MRLFSRRNNAMINDLLKSLEKEPKAIDACNKRDVSSSYRKGFVLAFIKNSKGYIKITDKGLDYLGVNNA